jgi:transcriptional regulator
MMMTKDDAKKIKAPQTELTHDEIAKELGITRTAVSLIEKKALEKVKRALRERYDIQQSDDMI